MQEHIREVRETLPRGYYRELPELARGPLTGYPRVYELATTLISHSEGRVDRENLDLFVRAFQEIATLSVGELWAIPAMLRLALIESVRRMALRTVQRMDEIEAADAWAARIEAAGSQGHLAQSAALDAFVRSPPPLSAVFVSRFLHQLRLIRGSFTPLAQIEHWIADRALDTENATARSTHHLAHTQVMMANSITSLRAIAHLNWKSFVEGQSALEAALRRDPSRFYERMTFETRDRYRHVVEGLARRIARPEPEVAARAVALAGASVADAPEPPLRSHVGYFLVDEGLVELEEDLGYRPKPGERLHRWVLRHPNLMFAGGLLAVTTAGLATVARLARPDGWGSWLAVLLVALLPVADIALSVVNQLITAYLRPRTLPKLDLHEHGIPAELRTAVVVPTLFGSVAAVEKALGDLEVQFLANREANLHFALLSDFTDAPTETVGTDGVILETAVAGVRELNERYAARTGDAFYLFHRPRRWNPRQGVWMGWERKRGKLGQFNRFLRGGSADAFCAIVGDAAALRGVRYVITLDADTVLPPDAAPELIGALAHPLNRAVFDPVSGRVLRGYGILQPRVGVSLPSAHASHFAAIQSGHPGVDPYTTAVSDVYQDLYGEGSFTGKGIYDVDVFERATHGRFPENALLSHDLIEGSHARAGLVTEVSVYDDYPSTYLTWSRRKHRWTRGDWQLLGWLGGWVPGPEGREWNRLSVLSRWKILDNLRRSTLEVAQLLLLVAGWTVLPGSPLRWTALGLAAIAAPWVVSLLLAALRPPWDKSWRAYYWSVGQDARTSAQQLGLAVAFLPHQAWVSADAVARTLWRLFVSRRFLLEWQSASATEGSQSVAAGTVWRAMAPALAVAVGIAALIGGHALGSGADARPWALAVAFGPLFALWMSSPAIARALSAPAVPGQLRLATAQRDQATRLALLHWRFFDRFVSAETQWLVPDNFQEDPAPVLAMRTSPTNLGLQLLAVGSARDLGFITTADMTERLERVFRSLEHMPRYRGHFYNWYDLNDLQVLEPAYVSTVDSGNLVGHLIALRQACVEARGAVTLDRGLGGALRAALGLAAERVESLIRVDRDGAHGGCADLIASAEHLGVTLRTLPIAGELLTAHLLTEVSASLEDARVTLRRAQLDQVQGDSAEEWIGWCLHRIEEHRLAAAAAPAEVAARLDALADRADRYVAEMDFGFLFAEARELFSIGYHPGSGELDPSYYDLLASESRLASFVAIAKNEVPVDHWFRLGRSLTHAGGETALVSWSGSMFEYLMPGLVMRSFPATLLDLTSHAAVRRQVAYGEARGVPWGLSESAYNARDRHQTYQYRAFGVPDLALKRGLGHELVIAPYASALAAMVAPERALANLAALERKGALGSYGFHDALDYTRPESGRRYAVVGTYMAHHIGMSLVALTNVLTRQAWPRRFHADPLVRSAELLLHERIPRRLVLHEVQQARPNEKVQAPEVDNPAVREFERPDTARPHIALLGRLPYTVMISHCGGGYSRYGDIAVTRWRSDGTTDATGQFCYVKDVTTDRVWSVAHQPVCAPADWYRALLATDRVTFHRSDGGIETRTEVVVVPEDSAEVRRVTLTNRTGEPREIELTSYAEIVLGSAEADRVHPAFANLFVQTEWHEWCTAITATRRPRSPGEPALWCVHVVDAGKDRVGTVSCETDRNRFLGRGATPRAPLALATDGPLSGTTGAVLDPVFALRTRVRLSPGESASVAFTTLIATSRERAFELADRYHDAHAARRSFDLTWTAHQAELRELSLGPAEVAIFQELAGCLFFARPELRVTQAELARNRGSQPLLWENSVSGDWPIVIATIGSAEGLPTLRQLLAAHHYWRRHGMTVDLVIVNDQPSSYFQELHQKILEAMFAANDTETDRPGGVFVRRRDQMGADALLMLQATARLTLRCDGRSLAHVVDLGGIGTDADAEVPFPSPQPRRTERPTVPSLAGLRARERSRARLPQEPDVSLRAEPRPAARGLACADVEAKGAALLFDNGLGGLTTTGDYRIRVRGGDMPPLPWANVVANPHGGFVVSEGGAGVTWAASSYFYRLSPWHNDPVSDPASEVLYLRDGETGELWSATPAPVRRDIPYAVTHGPGASVFDCEHERIQTRLTLAMAEGEAVKLSVLRVTNCDVRPRRIVITAYVEWTLGVLREHTQHQVLTTFAEELGAVLAQNFFDPQFAGWVAFCALTEPVTAHTGDRQEFLGRNGSTADPAALRSQTLAGTTGVGMDPCAALECVLELAPGETRELAMILGAAEGMAAARATLARHRGDNAAASATADAVATWKNRLSVVTVRTPDASFDAMLNGWTLYQALACRMWARTALYQSSGAYGFRDQLQDVLALVYAEPALARAHILRASARQFVEGDVQHWWHPQSGRGVRSRFSDDLAWLPYCVDRYVSVTGDASVLDELVPFLRMRTLEPHEHEVYDLPAVAEERASVYEHCLRALVKACTTGAHGLPLMGGGDWNDGMNRVGAEGRGESVWLAWFLIATLREFAERAATRGDWKVGTRFRAQADAYAEAVARHGWDGAWYRRAFFDDGTPLGSSESIECRIDSIAQSWSVISGAGSPDRQRAAMRSLEELLVRPDERLIALLAPPFDQTVHDPGYIKGYLPGVRENGAQYTHASLWAVLATALLGDGDRAFDLYQMLNPLTRTRTADDVARYQGEPYAIAADVYTAPGHVGRAGWTWYTGSASWMYRVGLEAILGFTKRGDTLRVRPCVPREWPEFSIDYRFGTTLYAIRVVRPGEMEEAALTLDGRPLEDATIHLLDDGARHEVVVTPSYAARSS